MSFRAPMPVVIAAIGLVIAGLLGLGVWQVYRYHWSRGVIAEANARTDGPAVDVATLLSAQPDDVDYQHVAATGTWDNAHTMLIANRVRFDVLGVEAVTPLRLATGGPAVLVDRGWFPTVQQAPILARLNAETTGQVVGIAIAGNSGAFQTPAGAWSDLDPVAMGRALPYPALPWAVLQGRHVSDFQFDNGALPLQQYLGFQDTSPHVEYAMTWFGLAAALLAISVIRFVVAPRREGGTRRAPPAPEL